MAIVAVRTKSLHMNSAEITWINAGASYVYLSLFQYLSFSRLFMSGIDPSNFSRIHMQILANRCGYPHDTALEERLLANV
jgi:hypothetical protein